MCDIAWAFRQLRKVVWGAFGANAFWGALVLGGRYAAEGLEEDLNNVIGNLETAAVLFALLVFEFWDENRRRDFRNLVVRRQKGPSIPDYMPAELGCICESAGGLHRAAAE